MLYTFKPINGDPYSELQKIVKHIVLDIWCNQDGRDWKERKDPQFESIIADVENEIDVINTYFTKLDVSQIERVKEGYQVNNEIEGLCNGQYNPLTYDEIKSFEPNLRKGEISLSDKMKSFFAELYNNALGRISITNTYGTKRDYYRRFVSQNRQITPTCPFCGLKNIKGPELSKRDAFDHFLPKAIFPFNTINIYNLFPTCGECNSDFKGSENPIYDKINKKRRRIIYPFAIIQDRPEILISLTSSDLANLRFDQIEISFIHQSLVEEVKSWVMVYGIEERYKDLCCSGDGKYWVEQVYDESKNYNKPVGECLDYALEEAQKRPLYAQNFLKKPFLMACSGIGLF